MPKQAIEDRKRIANNVVLLRKYHDEDRRDMLIDKGPRKAVNVAYSTLAHYENCERSFTDEVLEQIAKRYDMTVDLIKNSTFTNSFLEKYYANIRLEQLLRVLELLLSMHTSNDIALRNKCFSEAEDCFINAFAPNLTKKTKEEMLKKSRELYYKSFRENNIYAGAANTVCLIFWEYLSLGADKDSIDKAVNEQMKSNETYLKVKNRLVDMSEITENYIKDIQPIFDECQNALGKTVSGRIYAEYYTALKYFFCMINNGRTYQENMEIGYILLEEFSLIGNPLTDRFLNCLKIG